MYILCIMYIFGLQIKERTTFQMLITVPGNFNIHKSCRVIEQLHLVDRILHTCCEWRHYTFSTQDIFFLIFSYLSTKTQDSVSASRSVI